MFLANILCSGLVGPKSGRSGQAALFSLKGGMISGYHNFVAAPCGRRRNDCRGHPGLSGLSPHELYERKVTMQELHAAIASLPDKQAKRICAHFILGMTKQDIARAEGVHEKVVRVAIERGLRRLEKILKNSL